MYIMDSWWLFLFLFDVKYWPALDEDMQQIRPYNFYIFGPGNLELDLWPLSSMFYRSHYTVQATLGYWTQPWYLFNPVIEYRDSVSDLQHNTISDHFVIETQTQST